LLAIGVEEPRNATGFVSGTADRLRNSVCNTSRRRQRQQHSGSVVFSITVVVGVVAVLVVVFSALALMRIAKVVAPEGHRLACTSSNLCGGRTYRRR
jgi:hypothetical protein